MYGNFCGAEIGGRPGGVMPADDLDACCAIHDAEYYKRKKSWPCYNDPVCVEADIDFCYCIHTVNCKCTSPKNWRYCETAQKMIHVLFCVPHGTKIIDELIRKHFGKKLF